jgi:16S rRNA (uracil1498-N3)-methyltransferase
MARRRFFVDEVKSGRAQISGNDAHHLTRVLRVEAGQRYEVCDGQGVFLAEIEAVHKDRVTFSVLERLPIDAPAVRTLLYVSLIRFERFEWILEKATELGASRIVALQAERSEKGLESAAVKRMERWRRLVREASEQSRRASLPAVAGPLRLSEVLGEPSAIRLVLDEDPTAPPILQAIPETRFRNAEVSLLFGPEGGWTERERGAITQTHWKPVSLGPLILRTETAVLAALAIVNAAWQSES